MYGGSGPRHSHWKDILIYAVLPALLAVLILPALPPQVAQADVGDVLLVSANGEGVEGDNGSFQTSITPDGRYVAFQSFASNLVDPSTTNCQVFRKDLRLGHVNLVSRGPSGDAGNYYSGSPSISADGRYVAFDSFATDLLDSPTSHSQVFRRDLYTGEVLLVSCTTEGFQGSGNSYNPFISADGRYVAFESAAPNLMPVWNSKRNVFRKDLQSGEILNVSTDSDGNTSDGHSYNTAMTQDSMQVFFDSDATNLVSPATSSIQVFRKDITTGETSLVSCSASGTPGDSVSTVPSISPDGRYAVFDSMATSLVSPPTSGSQVFRKDLQTDEVELVSCPLGGDTEGNGPSYMACVSADGRYVAFMSDATNLVSLTTGGGQVFRKDMKTGEVELASADPSGAQGNNSCDYPVMTPDGRYVAFDSFATNLLGDPLTTGHQVFRKEMRIPSIFYFAEGYTGEGFQEYLCLGQPVDAPLEVTVTFMFKGGGTQVEEYTVPGLSRLTVDVNREVGAGREVSMKCQADYPFIAERPMYFDYTGAGGHWTGDMTWWGRMPPRRRGSSPRAIRGPASTSTCA